MVNNSWARWNLLYCVALFSQCVSSLFQAWHPSSSQSSKEPLLHECMNRVRKLNTLHLKYSKVLSAFQTQERGLLCWESAQRDEKELKGQTVVTLVNVKLRCILPIQHLLKSLCCQILNNQQLLCNHSLSMCSDLIWSKHEFIPVKHFSKCYLCQDLSYANSLHTVLPSESTIWTEWVDTTIQN